MKKYVLCTVAVQKYCVLGGKILGAIVYYGYGTMQISSHLFRRSIQHCDASRSLHEKFTKNKKLKLTRGNTRRRREGEQRGRGRESVHVQDALHRQDRTRRSIVNLDSPHCPDCGTVERRVATAAASTFRPWPSRRPPWGR